MEDWVKSLVLNFREKYENLSEPEKVKVNKLDNLTPPLQVEVIIIKNQQMGIEHQLFIFTHFEDKEDLEIKINGPIESQQSIENLEHILKDKKWRRKLPKGEGYLVRDEAKNEFATIIEEIFVNMLRDLKGNILASAFSKPKEFPPAIRSKTHLTEDSFVWQALEDVRKKEAKEIAIEIIEEAKKSAQVQSQSILPLSPGIKGFGTYLYPPIWIGKIPEPSFRKRIFETSMPLFPNKAFDAEYKGHKIIVNENGFIAIEAGDKSQALGMLNEIMATALILNIPFFAIREIDLDEAEINPKDFRISLPGIPVASPRAALFEEEWLPKRKYDYIFRKYDYVFRKRRELSREKLVKVIKQAEIITENEVMAKFLMHLLESYTHLQTSEYNQSFIMGWITIEKYLLFRWKDFLKEKGMVNKGKKKLKDWTISQILEALNSAGKITGEQYGSFIKMKRKRDKFVHNGLSGSFKFRVGEFDNLGFFKFRVGEFEEQYLKIEDLVDAILRDSKEPQQSFQSSEKAVAWLNDSILPYNLLNKNSSSQEVQELLEQIKKDKGKALLEFTEEESKNLAQTEKGRHLKRLILETLYPYKTPKSHNLEQIIGLIKAMVKNEENVLNQKIPKFKDAKTACDWLNSSVLPYQIFAKHISDNKLSYEMNKVIETVQQSFNVDSFKKLTKSQLTELAKTSEGQHFKRIILETLYPDKTPKNQISKEDAMKCFKMCSSVIELSALLKSIFLPDYFKNSY